MEKKVYKLPVKSSGDLSKTVWMEMGALFCGGVGTGFEAMNSEVSVSEQLNATKRKIQQKR